MTTHRVKIPRFCCGYFRPALCVLLFCLGGAGSPGFFSSRVNIPHFHCGYFRRIVVRCV